ncbi:hypothetical protein HPB47_024258 [Ixodes persulcatus]|uniref:Uncharacterized protein n=1 Tax=Ixodes persulcatus TaxID=34615 RepID=A0AC60Q7R0_IXOPE|nr:hypothetical protein HPB47_024258 [Ixodes persulcatus]
MRTESDPKDLPPDRVRDLAVKDVNRTSGDVTVTISWTSTGANLDAGKATSLDLRSSLDLRELIYNFQEAKQLRTNNVLEGSLTPEDPYRLQTVKVRLPKALVSASQDKPGSIFLGLRTKNDRGKLSQLYTPTTSSPEPFSEAEKRWPHMNMLALLLVAMVLAVVIVVAFYTLKHSSDKKSSGEVQSAGKGDPSDIDTT